MLNKNSPISGGSVAVLSKLPLQERPDLKHPLPLKFMYYRQTSPHEKTIAQAFYRQAIDHDSDWQATAEAVCYRYGIGQDYLNNCLSKVRVFNPNFTCVDCEVLYQIIEPTRDVKPMSNVYRYIADGSLRQENEFQQSRVYPELTGEWRCMTCQVFRLDGNLPQEDDVSF